MTVIDLEPATRGMAELVAGVPDDMLDRPTPCPAYALGDLLHHISDLTLAFTAAGRKDAEHYSSDRAPGDASRLGDDWRTRIPRDLATLAEAWRDPAAWTGMTHAGGVDLPGHFAGLVVLDELVVHAWDLARASGQAYGSDQRSLEVVHDYLVQLTAPEQQALRDAIFGPVVEMPDDAPLLDRVLGLAGRDPDWSPR